MRSAGKSRPSLPPPGALLGERYRLIRMMARGGMGVVYEAQDERVGRPVAVKVLHPELTEDRDVRRRFRRESAVLEALNHPCVVDVLDLGTSADELLYSVMELLEGETLAEQVKREGALSIAAFSRTLGGIADGLDAAHAHGVIHGDLKPANVFLVGETQDVKLLDFGLSKVLGLERLTRTGELIGTPAYMSPELLTGKGELDERIDTYALGVLMYECLSGSPPFSGRNPGKLMMDIVMGNTTPLAELAPQVPAAISEVVMSAMSRQRERRFHTASALARAFRDAE